jgi:23S rRNA (guanosine2251-2'-O)-methyltransferase
MAFRIPLVMVGNINNTLRDLKEKGFWVYGLDETATQLITEEKFDAPTAFVLGNEGTGIREKTRELCDILLSIPMSPKCESLNAATSGAIAFYAWSAKHSPKK